MRTYALEMMLATMMLTCGIILLWPGETFALPHYSIMRRVVDEQWGGALLAGVGTARWVAILKNGHAKYGPIWRVGGCMIGCGFWLTMLTALEISLLDNIIVEPGPPLLLAVAGTAGIFEIYAALRGGTDANVQDSLGLRAARSKVGPHGENLP